MRAAVRSKRVLFVILRRAPIGLHKNPCVLAGEYWQRPFREFGSARHFLLCLVAICTFYPAPSMVHSLVMAFPTGESSSGDLSVGLQADRNDALPVLQPNSAAIPSMTLLSQVQETAVPPADDQEKKPDSPPARGLTEQEKTCIGAYISSLKIVFHVEADGKQLCTTLDGKRFCLVRQKDGFFKVELKFLGLISVTADQLEEITISFSDLDGQKAVILHKGEEQMVLGKMVTPSEIPKAWLNRTGLYEFVGSGDKTPDFEKLSLSCQNKLMILSYKVKTPKEPPKSVALKPTSDTEATILNPDGEPGETVRIVNVEGIERLQFSGYELVREDAVVFPTTP